MDSKQKAAKKQPLTIKQLQAQNRQLKKDLAEEDRVNNSAVKKIDELRLIVEGQKQTIDLQRRVLELQAGIFSRMFNHIQVLNDQMQTTLQKS
jgi:hypothetical protein